MHDRVPTLPEYPAVASAANAGPAWGNPFLISRLAASCAILTGGLVVSGWIGGVAELRALWPGDWAAINPTTAVSLMALGSGLWLLARPEHSRSREIARALALLVVVIGGVRLYGILFGESAGIDAMLFGDAMSRTPDGRSNRMSPNAAVNLVLLGSTILLQVRATRFTSVLGQLFAVIVLFTAQAALIGHAFQSGWFETMGIFNRMPIPTALAFAALALGFMTLSSREGLIGILLAEGPGGSLARILLPTSFLVPAVLGWVLIQTRRSSLLDPDLGDTLFVLVTILVLVAIVAWIASQLHESHIDRVRTEQALRESEMRFRLIAENGSDVVTLYDDTGRVTYVSPSCERVLGFQPDELLRMVPFAIVHPEDNERLGRHFNQLVRGEPVTSIQCRMLHKTGRHIWLDMMWRAVFGDDGRVIRLQSSSRDVTENKQYQQRLEAADKKLRIQQDRLSEANQRLEALAATDALTGLKNRRAFEERLEEEVGRTRRHGHQLSLILLDIDYFKSFNDTFGHPKGDDVLRTIGRLLKRTMRETDFPARYGGEEFAVILPSTPLDGAEELAERLRRTIEETRWDDRPITASIGLASISREVSTAEALLDQADRALYRSKQNGRNRVTTYAAVD